MIRKSLALRVLAISFLVLALPILIDAFIVFQESYTLAIKNAKSDLREAANFRAFALLEVQPVKQVLLEELIYFLDLDAQPDPKMVEIELKQLVGKHLHVFVLDEQGKVVVQNQTSVLDPALVKEGAEEMTITSVGGHPFIVLSRGFKGGRLIVAANVTKPLGHILKFGEKVEGVSYAVLSQKGFVLDSTGDVLNDLSFWNYIRGDELPFFEFLLKDERQIAYVTTMPEVGLSVVAFMPKRQFFAGAITQFVYVYALYALIFIVGGALTYWLSIWLAKPLRHLTDVMSKVKQGDLDVSFTPHRFGFELNELGSIFNRTKSELINNMQRAEDERVKREKYEREVAIGRQVQASLLPVQAPSIPGLDVAGTFMGAREVGGDLYGYLPLEASDGGERLMVTVVDAVGRGLSPCIYALSARSLLRAHATLHNDLGVCVDKTNAAFCADVGDSGTFVSLLTGVYESEKRNFTYVGCGHVLPLLRKANGQIERLKNGGMPLGVKASEGYTPRTVALVPGDCVLFFTKGVEGIEELLEGVSWGSAEEIVKQIASRAHSEEEVIIIALKVESE